MPFQSTAQQRFAFATRQPWAERWAAETDFLKLPKRAQKRLRQKDYGAKAGGQIKGNLYRGGDGKFSSGSSGGAHTYTAPKKQTVTTTTPAAKKKGGRKSGKAAKPKQTADQKAQARQQERAKTRDATLGASGLAQGERDALTALAGGQQADGAALAKLGLAEQDTTGAYRLTASGRAAINAAERGDAGAMRDAVSRGRDAVAKRGERERAAMQRTVDRAGKKIAQQAAAEQRKADIAKRRQEAQAKRGAAASKRESNAKAARLAKTDAEEARQNAATERAAQQAQERQQRETARTARQTQQDQARTARQQQLDARRQAQDAARAKRQAEQDAARAARQQQQDQAAAERSRVTTPQLADLTRKVSAGETLADADKAALVRNGLATQATDGTLTLTADGRRAVVQKAAGMAVFKDASGALRWVTRTTTTFEDRDREIISAQALDDVAQRMTATGRFGPLRLWHIGQPYGAGLDIGDCDTSMLIGRTLIESGTFRSKAWADAIAQHANEFEISPGFVYTRRTPDGVFESIDIFERSLVPVPEARASNRFTGLAIAQKETTVTEDEIKRRIAALETKLGADAAQQVNTARKSAEAQADAAGVAHKEAQAPAAEMVINGVTYVVKAAGGDGGAMPPAEMEAAGATEMEDGAADAEEDAAEYVGDLAPEQFKQLLKTAFAEAIAEFGSDITSKLAEVESTVAGLGYAKKEADTTKAQAAQAAQAAQQAQADIAKLEAQLKEAKTKLAELAGEQPSGVAAGVRDSLTGTTAHKEAGAGPAAPLDEVTATANWLANVRI